MSTQALEKERKLRNGTLFFFPLLTDLMNVYRKMMRKRVLGKYYNVVARVSFRFSLASQSSGTYFPMLVNNF